MKATFFLAAAGLVAAQDFGGQPECALKCLQENIPKAGCKLEDTACQCASDFQEKLLPIITPCLTKACEAQDLLKAQSAAAEACKEFAKTAGSSKPTATSAATSGAVTVSIDTSVTGSASVPAIFSSIPETVVPTPHPGNGTSTKTNGASTPTGSGSGSGSGSESSASSVPTGNAAAIAGPAFGLLAALGAVLAL
ncbi:cell wall protein [Fusarium pseudoanthophilum]|uniref:Cell wall protein n=1 Tax=Fusarium pseudoanthophilum TaxID=48495 RepID=A0A8H5L1F9_9HYPO|nr:cell wall protein [Fusarium pseudoanthophilum]